MTHAVVAVFLAFFATRLAVENGLALLEAWHVRRTGDEVPPPLRDRIDAETARRSRAYALARLGFGIVEDLCGSALVLGVLLSGVLPALDATLARHGLAGAHRFVVFLVALSVATTALQLPWSLYATFVLEARFGFNRTTPALWVADRVKGWLIAGLLGVPVLYASYGFFVFTGGAWWLWLSAFLTAVQLAIVWLYPTLIAPLFNRFEPLPQGDLRTRLEAMALQAGFRTRGLYLMDASRRSGHSNAYFTGLFRPRIVLFDTLVNGMTVEETAAVLAHEIGHFRAHHVHKRVVLGIVTQVLGLWMLSLLVAWPPLFTAFGFPQPSLHAAIALVALGGGAFTFFLEPIGNLLSRRHEYEADRYSVAIARAPDALRSALVKLNGQNLSSLHPHPWYSAWHHSHPVLLDRLSGIEDAARRAPARATPDAVAHP